MIIKTLAKNARYLAKIVALVSFSWLSLNSLAADELDIPYQKYTLNNGLTLIVHEDNKAPIVAVNVWYHVGSKNEKEGKTGFAHLFEHLMFNGSENYNDDYFKPFDRVGATGMNGTTNFDRTNYFQVVPKNALDMVLWMESDRMGHLLGAVDQAKLDEQRGVVQNEKRQGENQPYGKVFLTILDNMFPQGHPYSHSVIGSMEDLNAASLDDVKEWFNTYYGAANTTLVVAGDVKAEAVKARVEHYFGHIPAGPPLIKPDEWIAKLDGKIRTVMQDRVPQPRIYKLWKMPSIGSIEANQLDLVAGILSEGKNSRLYKRLVYTDQIASDVSAFAFPLEISGMFGVIATALPGKDLADVEKAIDEEVARFLKNGPNNDEIKRVVTERKAQFIRGNERIGGFGGKSDTLARNQVYLGQPDFYKTTLARWAKANKRDLKTVANQWMNDGEYVLEVHPFSEKSVSKNTVDRSKIPMPESTPEVKFADIEKSSLSNGMKVILAQRDSIPVINMRMVFDAGYAADHNGLAGTASMTLEMLDEGTKKRDALEISESLQLLGANLYTGSNLDQSFVRMSALSENFDESLRLFADVILNPSFPEKEFERLKTNRLASIGQEKVQPRSMAMRVLPKLLYGQNHAYGSPMTGSGYVESVEAMKVKHLRDFHSDWLTPNNATLVVVGDISMTDLKRKLEEYFADWKGGKSKQKQIATVAQQDKTRVYLIDRPESEQSIILAGHLAPPTNNSKESALQLLDGVLGGSFNARVNMNLREDKGWSYGARTNLQDAEGQRPYTVYAPIQTDKTAQAMAEIYKELVQIKGEKPATAEEIAAAKDRLTLTLAGRWETASAVERDIVEMVRFGYDDDYWNNYAQSFKAVSSSQINEAANALLQTDKLIWLVVGDRKKIEAEIKSLDYGEIILLDSDGNPVDSQ